MTLNFVLCRISMGQGQFGGIEEPAMAAEQFAAQSSR